MQEQDVADLIAGHFQTSRARAYELMEKALLERGYAHAKTDTQTAVAAECERWRGFTAHCQRVAAALKAQMSPDQVLAHLGTKMAESIDRMTSCDSSDLDPDLIEWAEWVLKDGERWRTVKVD